MSTLKWFATVWLGLTALNLITTDAGAGKVTGLLGWATTLLDHALSPAYPGLADFTGTTT
jgi:hypothetical protein